MRQRLRPRRGLTGGLLAVMGLVALLVLLLAAPAVAQDDLTLSIGSVDLTAFPKVSAVVQLGGSAAPKVGDLTAQAFFVSADGSPISGLSVAAAQAQPVPTATVLLIDESGSMRGAGIAAARQAAQRFIEAMRPVDRVAIQSFSEDFRVLHDFSGDKASLIRALDKLSPAKETALYDALGQSLPTFRSAGSPDSLSLVILSDGGDTVSRTSLDQAVAETRASGVQAYAVGLKTKEFDSAPLQQLASVSGGRYLETPDPATLTALYEGLAHEIHNQYRLEFSLPPEKSGSGAGELQVKVQAAGYSAPAVRGFFYPGSPNTATQVTGITSPPTTMALPVVEEKGAFKAFVAWRGSDFVVVLIVAALVFLAMYVISGVLFPRRNVLAEYGDILDNRRRLSPRPELSEEEHPGERTVRRFLRARGYQDPLQRRIENAGWPLRTSEFVFIHLVAVVVTALVLSAVGLPLLLNVVLVVLVVMIPLVVLDRKARKRRETFEAQVPDTLMMLANSLRAGQGFEQALHVVAAEGPDPTAHEFRRLLAQQRLGVSPEDTLRSLADRMESEAFDWVVMATIIQRQVGGNLAEVYERIADTLRERERLRREVRTLTAEGRLSAGILILLPFGVALFIAIVNMDYVSMLWTTRAGIIMLAGAIALMIVGIMWLTRLVRFDI